MNARKAIAKQVQIRGAVAVWVLAAHAYGTLVPLVLVVAAALHWDYLQYATDRPWFLPGAAVLLATGSAFEVAQNAIDRWYLTPDTGSALQPAFCDFFFFVLITAGQACLAVALAGREGWVVALAASLVVAQVLCYLAQRAVFAPLAASGVLVAVLGFDRFGDPVIFLSLPVAGLTMYFFNALLKTGSQALHGFTTSSASSGPWFLVWGIANGAAGTPRSWGFVAALVVVGALAAAAAWPVVSRLPATAR
jgi:hypothetical protein